MCARGGKGDVQLLPSVSVPKLSCPTPRTVRVAPAGVIFHVLNRANARARIFEKDLDYEAFNRVIAETANLVPVEIFAYTIMPTHWHMVLRPTRVGDPGKPLCITAPISHSLSPHRVAESC